LPHFVRAHRNELQVPFQFAAVRLGHLDLIMSSGATDRTILAPEFAPECPRSMARDCKDWKCFSDFLQLNRINA
jgi:hypothetical protein